MICTGAIMAIFQIPIIIIGMIIGQYLTPRYGFWVGLGFSLIFTWVGLIIFNRWFWKEWPFIHKGENKEDA